MKYFLSGLLFALMIGIGVASLAITVDATQSATDVAKDCTLSQVKDCYSGNINPCCPQKAVATDGLAKDCTLSQVKDCFSGNPNPNNTCCPPKFQMDNPIGALETDDSIVKNCTWTEVKLCYDGIPNRCCPPKDMMIS